MNICRNTTAILGMSIVSTTLVSICTVKAFDGVPAVMSTTSASSAQTGTNLMQQVQRIANEPDGVLRYQATEELAEAISERDIPLVLNLMFLPESQTPALTALASRVFQRWLEISPAAATEWISRLSQESGFTRNAYSKIGISKARANPTEAAGWIRTLPAGGNKLAAAFAVANTIAPLDPGTALQMALDSPPGTQRDGLVTYCLLNWAANDFKNATAWLQQQPNGPNKETMIAKVAVQQAIRNPAEAAALATQALRSDEIQTHAVRQIVRFWASATPESAAVWVAQLPDSSLRDAAAHELVEVWRTKDPARAANWEKGYLARNKTTKQSSLITTARFAMTASVTSLGNFQ